MHFSPTRLAKIFTSDNSNVADHTEQQELLYIADGSVNQDLFGIQLHFIL